MDKMVMMNYRKMFGTCSVPNIIISKLVHSKGVIINELRTDVRNLGHL